MAAHFLPTVGGDSYVSTHSHPKVAARLIEHLAIGCGVSTHSHPKVAAQQDLRKKFYNKVSTHSHPKVAALIHRIFAIVELVFQHTATRRWLLAVS